MDRNEFKEKAKEKIDEIFAKIDKLEAKQAEVEADGKVEYEKSLETLRDLKDKMKKEYDELGTASDEKWEEVKEAFNSSAESFKDGFGKLLSPFK